jgi:hypothetical protein
VLLPLAATPASQQRGRPAWVPAWPQLAAAALAWLPAWRHPQQGRLWWQVSQVTLARTRLERASCWRRQSWRRPQAELPQAEVPLLRLPAWLPVGARRIAAAASPCESHQCFLEPAPLPLALGEAPPAAWRRRPVPLLPRAWLQAPAAPPLLCGQSPR